MSISGIFYPFWGGGVWPTPAVLPDFVSSYTVSRVYSCITTRLLEDGGFQTGTFSEALFLQYFADTLNDFLATTGINKGILTQSVQFAISRYTAPDVIMQVENVFVGGRFIARTTTESLDNSEYGWRKKHGMTIKRFHEDELPLKSLEIFPTPDYDGAIYPFNAPYNLPVKTGGFFPADRNLTMVGPQRPLETAWALDSRIPLVPDSGIQYLCWGVLERIFGDNSELKDEQRHAYAGARYREGIGLFRSIMMEEMEDDPDETG